jgi:hypothetical protein
VTVYAGNRICLDELVLILTPCDSRIIVGLK